MSSDLISREALKEKLNFVYSCAYIESKSKEGIASDIIDCIDNAPTVEPDKELKEKIETYKNAYKIMSDAFENEVRKNTRPQGEWKFVKHGYYECSECEHLSYEIKSNFCPHCGAKMVGGAE